MARNNDKNNGDLHNISKIFFDYLFFLLVT